jgi:DNA primase
MDMKGRIPDEVIDQVRKEYDIVDVIEQTVSLKKSGKNYFGLCPFHSEKTPSFSVAPDKQIFYCFGCGKGGDVIKFVMELEQYTFVEAVTHLAEQAGIPVPKPVAEDISDEEEQMRRQMRKALDLAAKLYHYVLLSTKYGRVAREYLKQREIQPEAVKEFQLGYAPSSFQFLLSFLKKRGFSEEILEKVGLITSREQGYTKKYYDRFRHRLMFPIHDAQGKVIGFGGRALGDGQPKYLNSPDTILFHKRNHLYNLHRARSHIRKHSKAVLFEGYMDVISAWQAGVPNGVATLGTALSETQARILKRNSDHVILSYDSDEAGQNAAFRGIELLKNEGCTVKVAQMPVGLDPDEYIRRFGKTAFKEEILAAAMPLTSFKLEILKKKYDLQDEDERMKYLAEAVGVIAGLPQAIEQDHYLRRLAGEFHLSLDALKDELRKAKRIRQKSKRDKDGSKWNNGYQEIGKHLIGGAQPRSIAEKSEMYLIAHMMRSRSVTEWVKTHLGADFNTEIYAVLAAYLYSYYDRDSPEDPGAFIRTLTDPDLESVAAKLAFMELPDEISEKELRDCVHHIRDVPLLKQIEEKERQIEQLSRADEPVKAAKLLKEVTQLRNQLHMRI